ncbi:MAG: heme-binding protein [Candidatus Binatia bacterium]
MPGGGAIPVVEGGNVVGAIAVSGGTDDQDQKCAEVALAAYQG